MKKPVGPICLGKIHHPALGVRLPEIFLPGIIAALTKRRTAAGLMLSFGRETAPTAVIAAPAGRHPITLGHTGTSIAAYQSAAAQAARHAQIPAEVEADHLIVIGSAERAAARITGVHTREALDPKKLRASLAYNAACIAEATRTGVVGCFTTDTSDLFVLEADEWPEPQVRAAFSRSFSAAERGRLLSDYAGRRFVFAAMDGGPDVRLELTAMQAMRLALKYRVSLAANDQLYRLTRAKIRRPFSFEISMDETAGHTPPADAFFYLAEWIRSGRPVDYFAPNLGFGKRADYRGSLPELADRTRVLAAIAGGAGALLSIHSGSGATPYSGKGRGVYGALLAATGGRLKYKISGVYFELLLEILAAHRRGSPERKLYEEIFAHVFLRTVEEVVEGGPLATRLLIGQINDFAVQINRGRRSAFPPRADFFRFHSYLALALRNSQGRRFLREALVAQYRTRPALRRRVDREVQALTERLIDGLQFENNYPA